MAIAENKQTAPRFTPEDFLGGWRTIPNTRGLSEGEIKQAVGTVGADTDIIGKVDETGIFVLGKAKNFVRGIVSATDGNI